MNEGEWTVVRRRRTTSLGKPPTNLGIPVVPSAAHAASTKKKKKKSKKKEEDEAPPPMPAPPTMKPLPQTGGKFAALADPTPPASNQSQNTHASAPGKPTSKTSSTEQPTSETKKVTVNKVASGSDTIFLLRWLFAIVAYVRALLGLSKAKKPKKKLPAAAQQPPAPTTDKPTSTPTPTNKNSNASVDKAPQPVKQSISSTPTNTAKPTSTPTPTSAPSASSTTKPIPTAPPNPTPPEPPKDQQPISTHTPTHTHTPISISASTAPKPTFVATEPMSAKPAAAKTPHVHDADWGKGGFWGSTIASAHNDVVSSVAFASDNMFVSGGYDGALRVWHWPASKPHQPPTPVKNLVGHSSIVEAVSCDAVTRRCASTGHDSSLKLWDLGEDGTSAKLLGSYFTYEGIKSMSVNWAQHTAALGAKSGSTLLWNVQTGKKMRVLRDHSEEVTAVAWWGDNILVTGSRDECVHVWDIREKRDRPNVVLAGSSSPICSLLISQDALYVGDDSSSIKVYSLPDVMATTISSETSFMVPEPEFRLPNALQFAGDSCPVRGISADVHRRVLVTGSYAWLTQNTEALEEAPPTTTLPLSILNVFSTSQQPAANDDSTYMYTLRLQPGVITCLAQQQDRVLVGSSSGSIVALGLQRGSAKNATGVQADVQHLTGVRVGLEEFSDDEDTEDDSEDDE